LRGGRQSTLRALARISFDCGGSFLEKNQNRLLASLTTADLALFKRFLHEVPLVQGEMLKEVGRPVDSIYFPLSGMISLIVEMPEDRSVEVGTVGCEAAIGLASGLGSRISSICALVPGHRFVFRRHAFALRPRKASTFAT
jgi:CRP-like cAMP-binding protein